MFYVAMEDADPLEFEPISTASWHDVSKVTWPAAACVPPAGMPPPPPPIGQAPSPPAPGPALPPELPYYTRGGYVICRVCNLATPYCKGHPRPPASVAQDGDCDSTLNERIAECQGSK